MNGQDALHIVQWAQEQLVRFGRLGATRVMKVPDLTAVVPIAAAVLTPSTAQPPLLTFTEPGTVIALYGQELTGTLPKFASTEVGLQFSGDDSLVSNGKAADFFPLLGLVGFSTNWFPMLRRVGRNDSWTITYRSRDTVATAFPSLGFAFLADADLNRVAEDMARARERANG